MKTKTLLSWATVLSLLAMVRAADDATPAPAGAGKAPAGAAEWRALPLIAEGKVSPDWVHTGWGGFEVDDGALRTVCDPRGLGMLVYKKEKLGNCQIRLMYKTKSAQSNSGVHIRVADGILDRVNQPGAAYERDAAGKVTAESMEKMKQSAAADEGPWYAVHHGYEVQIADGGNPLHGTGSLYSLASTAFRSTGPGVWRTMVITLIGKKVSVEIEGVEVTTFDPATAKIPEQKQWYEPKRGPERPEAGYLALQTHDPGDVVWFKEISVRPVPADGGK